MAAGMLGGMTTADRHELAPLVVIGGPTGTGKTELAIRLAEALTAETGRPVEIISADSRQVFRGLDIGTAKVGAADRARVPHHGLDLVDPDQPFTVADFATHARGVLADLASRDGVGLLVGGTGFYLRAVARGLDTDALPSDPAIRARLEAEAAAPTGCRRSPPGWSASRRPWPRRRTWPIRGGSSGRSRSPRSRATRPAHRFAAMAPR